MYAKIVINIIVIVDVLSLKEVKKVICQAKSSWFYLGIELDIELDTLKVSETSYYNYRNQ